MPQPQIEAKQRIILPLDFPSFEAARPCITLLKDHVGLFKVGLTLFFKEGLHVLRQIDDLVGGRKIFLDLKLYDTPMQVAGAARILQSQAPDVRFLTVHASGGLRVIQAVVEVMKGTTEVLGVTALTSQDQEEATGRCGSTSLEEHVLALADIAKTAGAAGVVASAHESGAIKNRFGETMTIVTPGIRPSWARVPGDDQRRKMTPAAAIACGADYLVIGRPIYGDKDPVGAAKRVAEEIEMAGQCTQGP